MTSLGRARSTQRRASRAASATGTALLVIVLAACGSQLDPGTVARVNGTGTGAQGGELPGTDTGAVPDGSVPDGSDPGVGTDPGSGTDPGTGDGEAPQGDGDNSSTGGGQAASCDGFDNDQPGVSSDKILLANSSDISGPVPGIFESAQQATRAYVAYFNATSDICGHKLDVELLDSRADAGADQQAYARACDDAFAAVGSVSAFDSGGADTAQACGLPDVRAYSLSSDRTSCTTCFAAYAVQPNLVPNAMPQFWVKKDKEATEHVGMLYINAGAAPENAKNFKAAWEANGWNIDVFAGIDVAEFNYAPYVQQLKDAGVEMVNYIGPYQNTVKLQAAMKQQGYEPKIFFQDATIEDANYIEQAGDYGNGAYVYTQAALFDDYSIPEMKLYRSWLQQIDPGAVPNIYGVYAWSATRLFVEQAVALGGKLSRQTLIQALGKVKNWTGNGIHVPQQVGAETTANCASIIQLNDGKWTKVSPGDYLCGSMTNTGLGG
jgi:ABC-type branched-subunit amino acid transport system substrate-binding protein